MRSRVPLLLLILSGLLSVAQAAENVDFLPAGMLLTCSLDEPHFSSKTVALNDPVLCHLSTTAFGRQVLPRGSYLTGRLADYRDPGHFVGKGWLSIQFDRMVLPGVTVLPLSAKVVAVPKYKVDKEGRIDGRGHATRDTVEWMIPPLWPIKILTLPARGPYPTLNGEKRITLRLMEDVELPARESEKRVPMPPWATRPSSSLRLQPDARSSSLMMNAVRQTPSVPSQSRTSDTSVLTVLVMKDQGAELVQSYWLEGDHIQCVTRDGSSRLIPISALDFAATTEVNRERNVPFILTAAPIGQTSQQQEPLTVSQS